VLFAAAMMACNLIPSVNPYEQSFVGILGFIAPVLCIINIGFIFFWLFSRKFLFILIPAFALFFSWKVFSVLVGGHFLEKQDTQKASNRFSVMTYNVRLLDLYHWSGKKETRQNLIQFIKEKNPSVLCLQEFYTGNDSVGYDNIGEISDSCDYEYHAVCNLNINKRGKWGSVIFSHLPIVEATNHDIDVHGSNMLQQANISLAGDTFSIFNIHLKSNKFSSNETDLVDKKVMPTLDDEVISQSKSIYAKLKKSSINRGLEADLVSNIISKNNYPSILCGDLNDIPSSYVYFKMRGKLHDSFLDKSYGLGATHAGSIPVLRIDYLFFNPQIHLYGFEKFDVTYSDHYPLMAYFGWM
jgi:endonuclease/exonuclease/phosphatase family metal-dependent hydrolase